MEASSLQLSAPLRRQNCGKLVADRALSRLLEGSWLRSIDELG